MRYGQGLVLAWVAVAATTVMAQAAGQVFRDCPQCPEMIVVPAGSFVMGSGPHLESEEDDEYVDQRETPARTVAMRGFALGRTEVTFRQWDACVASGACIHRPHDEDWGRGTRPAINVSWHDAKQYLDWLSRTTGKRYRLPSEAEWEYAARAGTTTHYHCGKRVQCLLDTAWTKMNSHDHSQRVATRKANRFGLHDMVGNVYEWVEDCWFPDYTAAPADGRVRAVEACPRRTLRGGSWLVGGHLGRPASRLGYDPNYRGNDMGFRVARDE
ncbi:MAG: formylglycine-generating enzyme family protein [Alphaproteobacteria bacterium]|nr:formylglycine-generating enzyme family protein [Alphaproteobacteria bacterium]